MAGQIIAKGKSTWLVKIFQGRDTNGKRKYFSKTIHGTKKDAQTWLTAALREKDLGIFVKPAAMPLDIFLDKWMREAAKPRLAESTYDNYECLLKRHVRTTLGAKKLSDIKPLTVQQLYGSMSASGLSPRTVRYVHAILHSAFKQAVRWQMLATNPCDAVELPKQIRTEMKAFTPAEAIRFLEAAKDNKHGIIFSFALATGMRPEEYLALKWSDIDQSKGTVTVQRSLQWRKGGGWYFGETKTARSRRTIPLPASLLKQLAIHKRAQSEQRLRLGPAWHDNGLVFTTELYLSRKRILAGRTHPW